MPTNSQDGLHDAIRPRDRARLRDPDHVVFVRAIEEDRIIVTENAGDFRKLAGSVDVHPGLIILPSVARAEAQRLMDIVIAHLTDAGGERPADLLVNSVLTITLAADIRIDPLPDFPRADTVLVRSPRADEIADVELPRPPAAATG